MKYLERLRKNADANPRAAENEATRGRPTLEERGSPHREGRPIVRDIVPPNASAHLPLRPPRLAERAEGGDQAEQPYLAPPRILTPPLARASHARAGSRALPRDQLPPIPPPNIQAPLDQREIIEEPPPEKFEPTAIVDERLPVRIWEPAGSRTLRLAKRIAAWIVIPCVLAILLLATFVFAKFTITIYPKVETRSVGKIDVLADVSSTSVTSQDKKIPAMIIVVAKTLSGNFDSTGTKVVSDRAHGTVAILNAFNSSPQRLIAGTRFQDSSGKIFRLRDAVVIPGATVSNGKVIATSLNAVVIADQAGDSYNIAPTEFRIPGFVGTPKYDGFYAKSASPFTGGFVGSSKVVTADDLKKASETLTKQVVDALRGDLQGKAPRDPDSFSPNGGRETAITNIVQPHVGDHSSRFTVSVSGQGRLLVIRKSDLVEVTRRTVFGSNPSESTKTPTAQNELTIAALGFESAKAQSHLLVSGNLRYYKESNVDDLAKVIQTSTPKKAETYLRGREEIDSFRMKRFPPWLWFIPGRASGLAISVAAPE